MKQVENYEVEDTSGAQLQASEEGVARFLEAAYGLSVHWGLYSLSTGGNEWIYYLQRIPFAEYKKRAGAL